MLTIIARLDILNSTASSFYEINAPLRQRCGVCSVIAETSWESTTCLVAQINIQSKL